MNFDTDADFVADPCDNCPGAPNNDQLDGDIDTVGDACDPCIGSPNADADLDGYCDANDNCPGVPNPGQANADGDGTGDDCDPCPLDATDTCCPPTVDGGCTVGFGKGTLIKNEAAGKEKLIAKLLKGPLINQTDFGIPIYLFGTKYNLCIYDDTSALVGEIEVDRAGLSNCSGGTACWTSIGQIPPSGKGYKFEDTDLASDGVSKILLKGGPTSAGKSKILVKGKGGNLPAGVTALLTSTTNVTLQLRGDDAPGPGCWSVTLGTVKKQTSDFFKAK